MDYLLQCVAAMVLLHVKSVQDPWDALAPATANTDMAEQQSSSTVTVTSGDGRTTAVILAKIMTCLQEYIPHLAPFFQEEFLLMLLEVFQPPTMMEKIPGIAY